MNELWIDPFTVVRNCARGIRTACTFTPFDTSDRLPPSIFLSSMVTSTRSMSDFSQTVSWDRLPQRIAARIERSSFNCSASTSSARLNLSSTVTIPMLHRHYTIADLQLEVLKTHRILRFAGQPATLLVTIQIVIS